MRIGVVGLGIAGATAALLLARSGHEVEVIEAEPEPGPVGAGIWLQEYGQLVLDRLGLLAPLAQRSRPVTGLRVVTGTRTLLHLSYDDLPDHRPALGVHRGTLFELLSDAVHAEAEMTTGARVLAVDPGPDGALVHTEAGPRGPFDLVVAADGRNSAVRSHLGLTARDRAYRWGALWTVVDDPAGLAGAELFQAVHGTRHYLGVLPTGTAQASIFWSVRAGDPVPTVARWREQAGLLADHYAPLLDSVDHLIEAYYSDVVTTRTHRWRADQGREQGCVLIGDAAHAMSPQLGVGASMALHDAWSLAQRLSEHSQLGVALRAHEQARQAHVRWYQFCSRAMMPVFQSGLDLLAPPRNLLAPLVGRPAWVRRLMVRQVLGDRTSLWSGLPPLT